jgi:succinate dehydrogenase / fumarate reductase membrane anchor subunit
MTQKWEASAFKNPIARARGLGTGHDALHHWTAQRITAIANIPLTLWAVWAVVSNIGFTFAEINNWITQFPNAILMSLFIISSFYHAALGLQVVIEDYVHCQCAKISALLAVRLGLFALAATAIFSILKLAL